MDAGRGSSHRCQVLNGSSTLTILTKTYAKIYKLREWWSLEHVLGSWDMEKGSLWMFSCLSLLFYSSLDLGPVQTASARVLPPATGGGGSPCAGSAERSTCAVPIGSGTYQIVRERTQNICLIVFISFPFLSFYGRLQPRGSAPKEGDDVMARG